MKAQEVNDEINAWMQLGAAGLLDEERWRRELVRVINSAAMDREELATVFTDVMDTQELQKQFTVHAFSAPFVQVTRSDGVKGILMFQHLPRYYFQFIPNEE